MYKTSASYMNLSMKEQRILFGITYAKIIIQREHRIEQSHFHIRSKISAGGRNRLGNKSSNRGWNFIVDMQRS